MNLSELLFWAAALEIAWTYFGYAVLLQLVAAIRPRPVRKEPITPAVSLVITAYNEARRIRDKIENSLALDYPRDKFEIIVVSDGSTDGTDDIVREYAGRGVTLVRVEPRRGKHHGQRRGIRMARGEIILLSDATTFLEPEAARMIVRNFADPTVGVVSGEDRIMGDDTAGTGEGAYVRYEMWLRRLEARAGSLVGASGCFFAIRKSLAETWIDDMSSDFYMPIVARLKGLRTVPEEEAIGRYTVLRDPQREFQRKVRTILHGLEVLFHFRRALNPLRYGFFAVQLISHKLMRWLVPVSLALLLVTGASLTDDGVLYRAAFVGQLLFYSAAAAAALLRPVQRHLAFRLPLFFVMVNLSIVVAWYQYLTGRRQVVWDATPR